MKGASRFVASLLGERHDVRTWSLGDVVDPRIVSDVREFQPDLIHLLAGPSPLTAGPIHVLKTMVRQVPLVMTAMQPVRPHVFWTLAWPNRPDLILTQSSASCEVFNGLGALSKHAPLGISVEEFKPPSKSEIATGRSRLGVRGTEAPIVLHVGHLKRGRGIEALARLPEEGFEAAMVVSPTTESDRDLRTHLLQSGVQLLEGFQPRIRELYAAADVYLFPTREPQNAVELPLSVLEAMAMNLPVVTTPYPGIKETFQPGEGLAFLPEGASVASRIDEVLEAGAPRTRSRLLKAGLILDAEALQRAYEPILHGGG